MIKKNNILKQYKASTILDVDEEVYNLFDSLKCAINTLIGMFVHNYKSKNIHHFTQDNRLVLSELVYDKDAKVKYVYQSEFMTDNNF